MLKLDTSNFGLPCDGEVLFNWSWSSNIFKFKKISNNISEMVHDRDIV